MAHVGHPKPPLSKDTTPFSSLYVHLSPDKFPSPPTPLQADRPPRLPRSQDIKGFTEKLRGGGVMEEAPVLGGPTRGHEELPHIPMGEPGLPGLMSEL